MVDSIALANTILDQAFDEGIDITPMKLQKLIYIIYKEYIKETELKLFEDQFEVWRYGPVIPRIYNCFKKYGSNRIKDFYRNDDGSYLTINITSGNDFKRVFEEIWKLYKNKSGVYLSMLTHRPNTAWSNARDKGVYFLNDFDIFNEAKYE